MTSIDLEAIAAERERIRNDLLHDVPDRPSSSARGLHHFALICSDVDGPSSSTKEFSSSL